MCPLQRALQLTLIPNIHSTYPLLPSNTQVIKSIVQYSIPFFLGLAQAINSGGAMIGEESSSGGSSSVSDMNPPPPPLYKDFWGNKEQYEVKP